MYVRWRTYELAEGRYRKDTKCPHVGPGRMAYTPQVVETYRENGKVKTNILWAPGVSIRSCCIDDRADPVARMEWWLEVKTRIGELREKAKRAPKGEAARVFRSLEKILDALKARVELPTEEDDSLYEAWNEATPETKKNEPGVETHRRRLIEARRRLMRTDENSAFAHALARFGLTVEYTAADLKRAYYAASFAAHPDRFATDPNYKEDPTVFVEIKRARDLLASLI